MIRLLKLGVPHRPHGRIPPLFPAKGKVRSLMGMGQAQLTAIQKEVIRSLQMKAVMIKSVIARLTPLAPPPLL